MGLNALGWEVTCDTDKCYASSCECNDPDDTMHFALQDKWTRVRGRWYCPECSKKRKTKKKVSK